MSPLKYIGSEPVFENFLQWNFLHCHKKASLFVTVKHFELCLIFLGKDSCLRMLYQTDCIWEIIVVGQVSGYKWQQQLLPVTNTLPYFTLSEAKVVKGTISNIGNWIYLKNSLLWDFTLPQKS
jgi:hypothetical protein